MIFDIKKVKMVVAVPSEYTEKVRNAVCECGAGTIGDYSFCTSAMKSFGTFLPGENADPYIGEANKISRVTGEMLEFVCDIEDAEDVLKALKEAHPYEEPGVNIIPLIEEEDLCFKKKIKNINSKN